MKKNIDDLFKESYYLNENVIRFLMIENLALKATLHEKGLLDPEQYKKFQAEASDLVDKRVNNQIEEWKKSNPKLVEMLVSSDDTTQAFVPSKDAVVAS